MFAGLCAESRPGATRRISITMNHWRHSVAGMATMQRGGRGGRRGNRDSSRTAAGQIKLEDIFLPRSDHYNTPAALTMSLEVQLTPRATEI